jgi:hypothetical protein
MIDGEVFVQVGVRGQVGHSRSVMQNAIFVSAEHQALTIILETQYALLDGARRLLSASCCHQAQELVAKTVERALSSAHGELAI